MEACSRSCVLTPFVPVCLSGRLAQQSANQMTGWLMLGEGVQCVIRMHPVLGGQHTLKSTTELACETIKSFLAKAQDHSFSMALPDFSININKNKSFISFP